MVQIMFQITFPNLFVYQLVLANYVVPIYIEKPFSLQSNDQISFFPIWHFHIFYICFDCGTKKMKTNKLKKNQFSSVQLGLFKFFNRWSYYFAYLVYAKSYGKEIRHVVSILICSIVPNVFQHKTFSNFFIQTFFQFWRHVGP